MRITSLIILLIFFVSGYFYYQLTGNSTLESKEVFVLRVVDGDTIETDLGKVRLLGINTPERSMPNYLSAKNFLIELVENKTVRIESSGTDKYGRTLAHVFLEKTHINEELIKNGYASSYYYGTDKYYDSLRRAEEFAQLNKLVIWKESPDKNCLILLELKYKEDEERCTNNEIIKIQNTCNKEISIIFKDDATHIYNATIKANSIFTQNFSCIWNDEGDSLYAWDMKGMILFYRYGQ